MLDMGNCGKHTTHRPSQTGIASAKSRACAVALALALCCSTAAPLSPLLAHAEDDVPTTSDLPGDAQGSELPANPDAELNEGSESGTDSNSSQNPHADDPTNPSVEDPSGDNPSEIEEQVPSSEPGQETAAPDPQAEAATPATEAPSTSGTAQKQPKAPRAKTQSKLEGKMSKAQQAAELRAQAEAIVAQMNMMAAEIDACQAEYDEAENALEQAKAAGKESRKQLKAAKKKLNKLRGSLSEYVVEMYKRGGVTPYLDALVRSTSYKEFLTAWYMLDEVSLYGKEELHAHVEAAEAAETEAKEHEDQVGKAEKAVREARSKLNRTKLMYLSLAPHVARLNMEAAELEGNKTAAATAKTDFEAARATLDEAIASGLKIDGKLEGQGFFTHPCPGATYSSGFGYRTFDHSYHLGLDMAIGEGTPYYAADDGIVTDATNDGGYNGGAGNWIVIEHSNGVVTKYMHSLSTFVTPGERVVRGQAIGLVGNTGNSFGAHLHFQVEVGGTAVDPAIYL